MDLLRKASWDFERKRLGCYLGDWRESFCLLESELMRGNGLKLFLLHWSGRMWEAAGRRESCRTWSLPLRPTSRARVSSTFSQVSRGGAGHPVEWRSSFPEGPLPVLVEAEQGDWERELLSTPQVNCPAGAHCLASRKGLCSLRCLQQGSGQNTFIWRWPPSASPFRCSLESTLKWRSLHPSPCFRKSIEGKPKIIQCPPTLMTGDTSKTPNGCSKLQVVLTRYILFFYLLIWTGG